MLKEFGIALIIFTAAGRLCFADSFAAFVIDYAPAEGQFVNDPLYNDPGDARGRPAGEGSRDGNDVAVVALGGRGGAVSLHWVSITRSRTTRSTPWAWMPSCSAMHSG